MLNIQKQYSIFKEEPPKQHRLQTY